MDFFCQQCRKVFDEEIRIVGERQTIKCPTCRKTFILDDIEMPEDQEKK